jgi:hypothetical protein
MGLALWTMQAKGWLIVFENGGYVQCFSRDLTAVMNTDTSANINCE